MTWFSVLFILGIPLASFFFRIVVGLTGPHKIPLAWTFSYYSALNVTFISAFTLAKINRRNKVQLATFITLMSVCFGSMIGLALAKVGVLGHAYEDPSQGNVPFTDAIASSILGAFSGLGLGLGNDKWIQVLVSKKVNHNLALVIYLSTAVFSIAIALGIALLL